MGRQISHENVELARLYLLKFVHGMQSLYGEQHVSYNVHLMTHLADSVVNFRPFWATSAFIFEDVNRQLLDMFHGTQSVPDQIVKHFLGQWLVAEMANKCMSSASVEVKDAYNKLSLKKLPIIHAKHFDSDFVGFCVPHEIQLSHSECEAIDECAGKEVQVYTGKSFSRFVHKNILYTTSQYANRLKRNDKLPYTVIWHRKWHQPTSQSFYKVCWFEKAGVIVVVKNSRVKQ